MKTLVSIAFSIISCICHAQNIVANFIAPNTCPGERTYFSDISVANKGTIISWYWHFGDGNQSQTQHPIHKYATSGKYHIKLIITSDLGDGDSISKDIIIFDPINVQFSINASGQCFNSHNFNFNNETLDTAGLNFIWTLGDGTFSNANSIFNKTYANPSSYMINLKGINKENCIGSIDQTIQVFSQPKPNFLQTGECHNITINFFLDTSNIGDTFIWNFNNESSSTLKNPFYIFKTPGDKIVNFKITNNKGCSDSILKTIKIKLNPKADFTVDGICEYDTFIFTNKSKDANSYYWLFDGKSSTEESPRHFFVHGFDNGNVTLAAYSSNGCKDFIYKQININAAPHSSFDYTYSGETIIFRSQQSGNTKYRWLFGDGDSALVANTNHIYTDNKSEHTVCLKVINAATCFSETCKQITSAGILAAKASGFKIYPNPNSGNFTIEIDNPEKDVSVEIYNAVGEKVKTVGRIGKVATLNLDVSAGIYLVKVINGERVYNQKVSITK